MSAITEQQKWFTAQTNIWHPITDIDSEKEKLIAVQEPDQPNPTHYYPGTYLRVKPDGTEFTIRTFIPSRGPLVVEEKGKGNFAYGREVSLFIGATPEQALEERTKLFTFRNIIKVEIVTIVNAFTTLEDLSNIVFDYLDQTLPQALFIAAKKINIMARRRKFSDFRDNPLTDHLYPLINQNHFWSHLPFQLRAQHDDKNIRSAPSDDALAIIPAKATEARVDEEDDVRSPMQYFFNCRAIFSNQELARIAKVDGSTIQTDPRIEELIQEETRPLETLQFLINPPPADPAPANPPAPNPLPQPQSLLQAIWEGICSVFECISACLSSLWQCLAH